MKSLFNEDQFDALLHMLASTGGVAIAATSQSAIQQIAGGALFFLGLLLSHRANAATPATVAPVTTPVLKTGPLLAIGIALLLGATGCTSSQVSAAYKGETAAKVSVDAAMTAWGAYVAQAHPAVATELKVRAAFQAYQNALELAVDSTEAAANFSGTNAVANASSTAATAQVAAALNDLINLLASLGVKIN